MVLGLCERHEVDILPVCAHDVLDDGEGRVLAVLAAALAEEQHLKAGVAGEGYTPSCLEVFRQLLVTTAPPIHGGFPQRAGTS